MTLINRIFPLFLIMKSVFCLVQINITQININFPNQISANIPNCVAVDFELFLQISTSNYSSQAVYFLQQQNANSYSIALNTPSSFQIISTTDFISLSAVLSLRCDVQGPIADSFLLATQINQQPDLNNIQQSIQSTSTLYNWAFTANIIRLCTGVNQYGFNCNEQCTAVDDAYNCYTCGSNGQKNCCQNGDTNQNDCTKYNSPGSTTWSPDLQCSKSAENTYFWLMISFAIIIGLLLIILLLVLLELCCGLFTGHKSTKESSDDRDWIVEREPRANRQLYDADIHRTTTSRQFRRRNDDSRAESTDDSRPSPYVVSREGLENQVFDDESLRNQWVEPQPRRIALV